jgi:hypothetical protein
MHLTVVRGGEGKAVVYCDEPECFSEAEEGRKKCSGHRKQLLRRGRTSTIRVRSGSARDRLFEAFVKLLNADSEDDLAYQRALRRYNDAFRAAVQEHIARIRSRRDDGLSPAGVRLSPEWRGDRQRASKR